MAIDIGEQYFMCDECKICEDWERRLRHAQEYGYDFQYDYCFCDKIDAAFYAGGYCEDAFRKKKPHKKDGKRKTGMAYRRITNRKKKDRLLRIVNTRYAPHAGYTDWDFVDGIWSPVGKYVKFPKNSNRQRYWKKYSNRAVRRGADIGSGKSGYKRCFDYQWEID